MTKYTLKTIKQLTKTCYELRLAPLSQVDRIQFRAGQYVAISVKSSLRKSTVRCFSIASSAFSEDGAIDIGVRLSGKYTKFIKNAEEGSEVSIEGPFGEFTPDLSSSKKLVVIAGGIGVTPILSILRTIADSRNKRPTSLLYFNNQIDDVPYFDQISELSSAEWLNTDIILKAGFPTGITSIGELDKEHILEVVNNPQDLSEYYICGPSGFMKKAVQLLLECSIPIECIHTESFGSSSSQSSNKLSASKLTYFLATSMIILSIGVIAMKDFIEKELKNRESTETTEVVKEEPTALPNENNIQTQPQTTPTYRSPRSTVS